MSSRAASPSPQPAPPWKVWAGLWTIYVIWGSTYLAIRIMVRTVPPLLGAGLRFAVAGALMLAVLRIRRGSVRVTRRQLLSAAVVGTLLAAGGNGLVTVAEQEVPSSLAALLIASVPRWVGLLRGLIGERPGRATLAGVAIGFVGVALLLLPGGQPKGVSIAGLLLVVLAAASWATGSVGSGRADLPNDPLVSTGYQMTIAGVLMVAAGGLAGEDGERVILFGRGAVAHAPEEVEGSYVLLTTPRGRERAPALAEGAAEVHDVPPGPVDEVAAGLRGAVAGDTLLALGGGRVIDVV